MKIQKINNVVLIGSGNVATHLGKALLNNGICVNQVWSLSLKNAKILGEKLHSSYTNNLNKINQNSDLYLISIHDDAVCEIANNITTKGIVVHTSGSLPLSILSKSSPNHGVFYPFQTFTKQKNLDFRTVPLFIEGSNIEVLKSLISLGKILSSTVSEISLEKRMMLHIAGIFACNFSNHMFTLSKQIMDNAEISFDYLKPLIREVVEKALTINLENAQTGPAVRHDYEIIKKHINLLQNDKSLQKIYTLLSNSIEKTDEK